MQSKENNLRKVKVGSLKLKDQNRKLKLSFVAKILQLKLNAMSYRVQNMTPEINQWLLKNLLFTMAKFNC